MDAAVSTVHFVPSVVATRMSWPPGESIAYATHG